MVMARRIPLKTFSIQRSGVEWTDYALNFWYGCSRISPACMNCYAEIMTGRFPKRFNHATWGVDGVRSKYEHSAEKAAALNSRGRRSGELVKVFSNDMSDIFEDNEKLVEWRREAFEIIRENKNVAWLLLTKRADKIAGMLPPDFFDGEYRHVNLGVTCESPVYLWRLDKLRKLPDWGGLRWVSNEPALQPIHEEANLKKIDWLIYGGESAVKSRLRLDNDDWARGIMGRCREAGIPFFYKQNAASPGKHRKVLDGVRIYEWPEFRR